MKKSKLSRMLAAFLVLVMVLTMLPGTALAIEIDPQADETAPCQITEGCILADGHEGDCVVEEEPTQAPKEEKVPVEPTDDSVNLLANDGVNTLEELQTAIATGGEVVLSGNIEIGAANTSFSITNEVVLDLDGFSIVRNGNSSNPLFDIRNGGSLTLNDSQEIGAINSTYPVKLWSDSTFIMNGGSITSSRGAAVDIFNSAANVKVEINAGSLTANADNTFGIRGSENVTVDIKGGTITSTTNRLAMYVSGKKDGAIEINISGGSIQNVGQAIQAYSGAVINVSGNAEVYSETGTAISTQSGYGVVELNITGGSITTDSGYGYAIQAREESQVNISGGTIAGGTAVQVNDSATVKVTGGTLEGTRNAIGEGSGATPDITVTGGTFSHDIRDYLPEGLTTERDGDGNYIVIGLEAVYVDGANGNDANTGADAEHAVRTLEHALNLVADDGVIYICGTVTVDSDLTVTEAVIQRAEDFTGRLISVTGEDTELILAGTTINGQKGTKEVSYLVYVGDGATVNMEDGTSLVNNNETAVYVNNGGAFTMEGGEISNNTASTWGGGILSERGTLTLKGGEIKNNFAEQGAGVAVIGASAVLDGAVITENESAYYGGGVYVQGITNPAQFEMRSGSIIGNTAINGTGAGIFGYNYDADTTLRISGGTIKENVATNEKMGSAITLYGYNGSAAYPSLQLSGSPEIAGDVFFQNDYEDGYVIEVVEEFDPVNPIEVTRSNNKFDIAAVEYAAGLTPNLKDFVSGAIFETFRIDGQTLKWADASIVYFYDENGDEYKDNRHGVIMDGKIDPADAPTPTKTGYTLAGWRNRSTGEMWDFENDTVSSSFTRLDVVWSLNVPTVDVEAEPLTPHEGKEAVLTATADHELGNVTYSYQWYKDGVAITDATADTLNVSEAGSYTVKVKASDGTLTSAEAESEAIVITIEGHIFDDEWKYDENTHWHECGICQAKNEEAEHSFVWVIDKEATNYETGLKHEECTVCGYAKGPVEIPMTSIPGSNQGQVGGGDWDWPEGSGSTGSGNAGGTGDSTDDGKLPPNTGDTSGVALGVAILALAGVGIGATAIHGKKKR